MNKPIAIVLLAVLALVLILALKTLIPMFSNFLKNLPAGIFILFIVSILGVMAYLIYFLVSSGTPGGQMGNVEEEVPIVTKAPEQTEAEDVLAKLDHCIVLREDKIWIKGEEADMEKAEKYIDEHVESNTELVIVDDYSLASLHHKITKLCDKKGVNYRIENEKWMEQ